MNNHLFKTLLKSFLLCIFFLFPLNASAKCRTVTVDVCVGWKVEVKFECSIMGSCIKIEINKCVGWKVEKKTECDSTVVTLTSFTTTVSDDKVELKWETASEIDNAGFHIWRAVGEGWKDGDYSTVTRLTDQLIPAKGDGASYSYIDSNVDSGVTYHYGIEDIDLKAGSTFHCDSIESATVK